MFDLYKKISSSAYRHFLATANRAAAAGNGRKCDASYRLAFRVHAGVADDWSRFSEARFAAGNLLGCESVLRRSIASFGLRYDWAIRLADVLEAQGRPEQAEDWYMRCLSQPAYRQTAGDALRRLGWTFDQVATVPVDIELTSGAHPQFDEHVVWDVTPAWKALIAGTPPSRGVEWIIECATGHDRTSPPLLCAIDPVDNTYKLLNPDITSELLTKGEWPNLPPVTDSPVEHYYRPWSAEAKFNIICPVIDYENLPNLWALQSIKSPNTRIFPLIRNALWFNDVHKLSETDEKYAAFDKSQTLIDRSSALLLYQWYDEEVLAAQISSRFDRLPSCIAVRRSHRVATFFRNGQNITATLVFMSSDDEETTVIINAWKALARNTTLTLVAQDMSAGAKQRLDHMMSRDGNKEADDGRVQVISPTPEIVHALMETASIVIANPSRPDGDLWIDDALRRTIPLILSMASWAPCQRGHDARYLVRWDASSLLDRWREAIDEPRSVSASGTTHDERGGNDLDAPSLNIASELKTFSAAMAPVRSFGARHALSLGAYYTFCQPLNGSLDGTLFLAGEAWRPPSSGDGVGAAIAAEEAQLRFAINEAPPDPIKCHILIEWAGDQAPAIKTMSVAGSSYSQRHVLKRGSRWGWVTHDLQLDKYIRDVNLTIGWAAPNVSDELSIIGIFLHRAGDQEPWAEFLARLSAGDIQDVRRLRRHSR